MNFLLSFLREITSLLSVANMSSDDNLAELLALVDSFSEDEIFQQLPPWAGPQQQQNQRYAEFSVEEEDEFVAMHLHGTVNMIAPPQRVSTASPMRKRRRIIFESSSSENSQD